MSYFEKQIDSTYFTMRGFYLFYIPINVPYKKIYETAVNQGYKLKEEFGPILESGKLFGYGWIGIEIEEQPGDETKKIKGKFSAYEHVGSYKKIGKSFKTVCKDNPSAKEFYNLYLDNPDEVSENKLRTHILFR